MGMSAREFSGRTRRGRGASGSAGRGLRSGAEPVSPQMNVTPLVDVVLVLLLTFLVVTPLLTRSFAVAVPGETVADAPAPAPLVLRVEPDGGLRWNGEALSPADLRSRIERDLAGRADRVVYVEAAETAPYRDAVAALDVARDAGASPLALVLGPGEAR